jgi:hypothetical protein
VVQEPDTMLIYERFRLVEGFGGAKIDPQLRSGD